MTSAVATKTIPVKHKEDPKDVIHKALKGHLEKVRATAGDVILCIYERPNSMVIKGVNGEDIELSLEGTSRASEDKFQGIVGLIVAVGPDVGRHKQYLGLDKMPTVGDWVAIRRGDVVPFILNTRTCCLVQANFIRLVLQDPDVIL